MKPRAAARPSKSLRAICERPLSFAPDAWSGRCWASGSRSHPDGDTCLEPGGACELAPEFSTDPLFRLYGWSIGLFGNKADKREKVAVAETNSARLIAMPVLDLAAEIM